jgi:hypothetical protein
MTPSPSLFTHPHWQENKASEFSFNNKILSFQHRSWSATLGGEPQAGFPTPAERNEFFPSTNVPYATPKQPAGKLGQATPCACSSTWKGFCYKKGCVWKLSKVPASILSQDPTSGRPGFVLAVGLGSRSPV